MVLLGGLELVAAGYVLNELSKDDDKYDRPARSQSQHHRRRRDSSASYRPRPSRQNLMPPESDSPPRPTSAPPQQRIDSSPPGKTDTESGTSHLGPSCPLQQQPPQQPPYQQPPFQQQPPYRQPPYQQPPYQQPPLQQPPPRPQPQLPQQQLPPPYQAPLRSATEFGPLGTNPAVPPNSAYNGTVSQMYFDTKTGKWQAGMLPRDVPGRHGRNLSDDYRPPRRRERSKGRRYSSGSDSYSDDDDLAYGSLPGVRRSRRYYR
ncbi:hypothetical protein DV738_g4676, partial [Chaetothyriales sp. CBS 135597]